MQPIRRRIRDLDHEHERHYHMADDQDDEIGGRVVGAVVMKGFATGRATIRDLEEGTEHPAPVALRATTTKPAPDRVPKRSPRQALSVLSRRGGQGGWRRFLRRI